MWEIGSLAPRAHAPFEFRQKVLEGPLPRLTPATLSEPDDLRRTLFEVRRQGYAVSRRQLTEESTSVAAPVSIGIDGAIAALSVILPATADWRSRIPLVVNVARELSAVLRPS
jgi:DNA-binding IclR family transcriptional regulator